MATIHMEPLLRFENFEALLRWIPQNTEVYVIYDSQPQPRFRVSKPYEGEHPAVYELWVGVRFPDVRLGTGAEAETWLKRQRRISAVRVVRKDRTLRFTPVHLDEIAVYNQNRLEGLL